MADLTGIGSIFDFAKTVVDKIFPDADQKQKDAAALAVMQVSNDFNLTMGQIEVNKAEATNQSIFVSGWRPSIGWVCSTALAYQFVVRPIGMWAAAIAGHPLPEPPGLDSNLWELLFGMLGLGTLRTVEKFKGKS